MKIDVKQVLTEAVAFYQENFKKLAGISLITVMLVPILNAVFFALDIAGRSILIFFLFSFAVFFVVTLTLMLTPKLSLAMFIVINSLLANKKTTPLEAFHQTRGKYWTCMGCALLMSLPFCPYIILIQLKVPFIQFVGPIYLAFITSSFYTLFPMIAIEPKTHRYLRKSVRMIKGNYKAALILTFITSTFLSQINLIILYFVQGQPTMVFIVRVVYSTLSFFIFPFASAVNVIVYRKLKSAEQQ